MEKTMIEVMTAFDGCGKNCPDLDIDERGYRLYGERKNVWDGNAPICRNAEKCKRIGEYLEQREEEQDDESEGE